MIRFPFARRRVPALLFVVAALALSARPAAAQPVPAAVAGLLPAGSKLAHGSWGVFDTEFGKTFTGDLSATLPGLPMSCDITQGPQLTVSLKGDTAWEQPPMLEMAIELHESGIAQAKTQLPQRAAGIRSSNPDIRSATGLKEEKLPNGTLLYLEQVEECARHKGGNTLLRAFARRGATMFELDLFVTASPAEAVAMAKDALARFEKLDVGRLLE